MHASNTSTTVELFTHPSFASYRLRITEPTICDSQVKQYSGYLDITTGKHLFFWFFESRHSPETSDFIYWTNGERELLNLLTPGRVRGPLVC
jgi:cathepsin A (carboxypeptidase C)